MITPELEMASGTYVNLVDPQPETILLEDIAHSLSLICRFGGHGRRFYSVAEHAVRVAKQMQHSIYSDEEVFAALHHDDTEAYLGDVPSPLKPLLGGYRELEAKFNLVIAESLGFDPELTGSASLKDADHNLLHLEAQQLMVSRGAQNYGPPPTYVPWPNPPETIGWTTDTAREAFLQMHYDLEPAPF